MSAFFGPMKDGGRPLTAVVTGAASGIGRALAVVLYTRGADLVLADVDATALDVAALELGATPVTVDVADPAAMSALAAQVPQARLICLNAGVVGQSLGAPWEVPPSEWDRVFDVNLGGVVNGLRAFVPGWLASGERAHVLITASLAGLAVFPGGGASWSIEARRHRRRSAGCHGVGRYCGRGHRDLPGARFHRDVL